MHVSPFAEQKHRQRMSEITARKREESKVQFRRCVNAISNDSFVLEPNPIFYDEPQTNICTFREFELQSRLTEQKKKSVGPTLPFTGLPTAINHDF